MAEVAKEVPQKLGELERFMLVEVEADQKVWLLAVMVALVEAEEEAVMEYQVDLLPQLLIMESPMEAQIQEAAEAVVVPIMAQDKLVVLRTAEVVLLAVPVLFYSVSIKERG